MKCDFLNEKISGYLDRELSPEEMRRAEEHIETCPSCRKLVEDFRRNDALLRNAPLGEIADREWAALRAAAMDRIRDQAEPAGPPVRFGRRLLAAASLAAIVLLGIIGYFINKELLEEHGERRTVPSPPPITRTQEPTPLDEAIAFESNFPAENIAAVLEVCENLVAETAQPARTEPRNFALLQDEIARQGIVERISASAIDARLLDNTGLVNHLAGLEAFFVAVSNTNPKESPDEVLVMNELARAGNLAGQARNFRMQLQAGQMRATEGKGLNK